MGLAKDDVIEQVSFTPHEVNANVIELLKKITKGGERELIPYASDDLNKILRPQISALGEIEVVIARTGGGKSEYVNWRVRGEASRIFNLKKNKVVVKDEKGNDKRIIEDNEKMVVVSIAFEESVESKGLADCGLSLHDIINRKFDRQELNKRLNSNSLLPIIRVGRSSIMKNGLINLKKLRASLDSLRDDGYLFNMIAIDHINDIHHDNADDMRKATEDAAIQLSQMATDYRSLMVIASQAKPEIDSRAFPGIIPSDNDAFWTSKTTQLAWRVIGLYRPWIHLDRYGEDKKKVSVGLQSYEITPNLTFMRISKARENNAFDAIIPCLFDPRSDSLKVHGSYWKC